MTTAKTDWDWVYLWVSISVKMSVPIGIYIFCLLMSKRIVVGIDDCDWEMVLTIEISVYALFKVYDCEKSF